VIQGAFWEVPLIRRLLSDKEWECLEPFVALSGALSGRKPRNHRRVLDGIFWIARTGVAWRDLPDEFGKWSSVYRQFRRWTQSGLWELILAALNDGGGGKSSLQMIDSTIIRAHHCAAGAKGGLRNRVLDAQKWLYDQDPSPRQCAGLARSLCAHGRRGLRLQGLWAAHG
jgi:transposase